MLVFLVPLTIIRRPYYISLVNKVLVTTGRESPLFNYLVQNWLAKRFVIIISVLPL